MTKCTINSCPGEYEKKHILHTVKYQERVIVIENVPAEVCSVCGDVLLSLSTVEAIEAVLKIRENLSAQFLSMKRREKLRPEKLSV